MELNDSQNKKEFDMDTSKEFKTDQKIIDQINKVKEKIISNIDTQLKFVNLSEIEKLFI